MILVFFLENIYLSEIQEIVSENVATSESTLITEQKSSLPASTNNYKPSLAEQLKNFMLNIFDFLSEIAYYLLNILLRALTSFAMFPILYYLWLQYMSFNKKNRMNSSNSFLLGGNDYNLAKVPNVTLKDVIGIDDIKNEVMNLISIIKDSTNIKKMGCKPPKGIMLVGSPGVGKTLLAKSIAGESQVPFIETSGSSFMTGIIGQGAQNVRNLFEKARSTKSPVVIFIDEIDSIAQKRSSNMLEDLLTINQLLAELDGFNENSKIFVIGATNRLDSLDEAVIRPGRFDKIIKINNPSEIGRIKLLNFYLNKINPSSRQHNIDTDALAKLCYGFSPADIANTINQAGIISAKNNKKISQEIIEETIITKILGETRELNFSEYDKWRTAYHEAGHAVVSTILKNYSSVYTIIVEPRSFSLGCTIYSMEEQTSFSRKTIKSEISSLLGGMVSEEIFLGSEDTSAGASDDIKKATYLAKTFVQELGLSKKIGPILHNSTQMSMDHSESRLKQIDEEVKKMIDECLRITRMIISVNKDIMHIMAKTLIQKRRINFQQVASIVNRSY